MIETIVCLCLAALLGVVGMIWDMDHTAGAWAALGAAMVVGLVWSAFRGDPL